MIDYSIVIPMYNEEGRITKTLTQTLAFMSSFAPSFEIIVVDDGSKDSSVEMVETYSTDRTEISLIKNKHKGKGIAVRTGMLAAKGKYILMMDADMSTPIDELKRLANWIKENNFDIAIASREGIGAHRVEEPFYRHIMGRTFNYLVSLVAVQGFKDTQCGFKLFTQEAAKNTFSRLIVYGDKDKEISKPFLGAFDVEILFIAKSLGYSIKEVPVKWNYVPTTRLHVLNTSLKMARDVFLIRLNGLRGAYKRKV